MDPLDGERVQAADHGVLRLAQRLGAGETGTAHLQRRAGQGPLLGEEGPAELARLRLQLLDGERGGECSQRGLDRGASGGLRLAIGDGGAAVQANDSGSDALAPVPDGAQAGQNH